MATRQAPASLADDQLAELSDLLETRKLEAEASLQGVNEDARPVSLDEPIGRLSRMDAMQQQQMASARKARLETQLKQIVAALGRLRGDEYGDCNQCDEPIGYARLRAKPETPMCVACQEKLGR